MFLAERGRQHTRAKQAALVVLRQHVKKLSRPVWMYVQSPPETSKYEMLMRGTGEEEVR